MVISFELVGVEFESPRILESFVYYRKHRNVHQFPDMHLYGTIFIALFCSTSSIEDLDTCGVESLSTFNLIYLHVNSSAYIEAPVAGRQFHSRGPCLRKVATNVIQIINEHLKPVSTTNHDTYFTNFSF